MLQFHSSTILTLHLVSTHLKTLVNPLFVQYSLALNVCFPCVNDVVTEGIMCNDHCAAVIRRDNCDELNEG